MTFTVLSYQFLPNIIFILAVLGILLIILRRLPEAAASDNSAVKEPPVELRLLDKGLPAAAASKLRALLEFWLKKIWNFALEAKDLKPSAAAGYRIKKIFGNRFAPAKPAVSAPASTEEVRNEQYFLNIIKKDPRNLANYDALGRFYLERNNAEDARDIYEYLTEHDAANADYHARLAFCYYQIKNLDKTIEHYQKSLALDSSQPNRYYNLGLVLESLGRFEEAAQELDQAIALEPHNIKYYISLSGTLAALGEIDEAREILQTAKNIDPLNTSIDKKLQKISAMKR